MDYETLSRLASRTVFTIDTKHLTVRVRNTITRSIETGFLNVAGGEAAAYFRTIAERFKLPTIYGIAWNWVWIPNGLSFIANN